MSRFIPERYLALEKAADRAAEHWFAPEIANIKEWARAASSSNDRSGADPDPVLRSLSAAATDRNVTHAARAKAEPIIAKTVVRMRQLLHGGKLTAYYSCPITGSERPIEAKWWAGESTDGVIESGVYFPFGRAHGPFSTKPGVQVRVREDELLRALEAVKAASEPQEANVAAADLREFVLQHADPTRSQTELLQIATDHFAEAGKRFPRKLWRDVIKAIPANKMRRRGENARTRQARGRAG